MTLMERAKRFPVAVQQIYKDWQLYRNIDDASHTKLNAWTLNHPLRPSTNLSNATVASFVSDAGKQRAGLVPRRMMEHQRRLKQDLAIVSPLVLIWLLPIIGYLPMILAFVAPRQVLSRHFWNEHEIQLYRQVELEQRKLAYAKVADMFFQNVANQVTDAMALDRAILRSDRDAGGPLLDLDPLYEIFIAQDDDTQAKTHSSNASSSFSLVSLNRLPRDYLVQLSLAIGIHQRLPSYWAIMLTQFTLSYVLKLRITHIAQAVARDDAMLLLERANLSHDLSDWMAQLTDEEVRDASLLRGLPVNGSLADMRLCLNNHLDMVQPMHQRILQGLEQKEHQDGESHAHDTPELQQRLGLLTLHIPLLRSYFQKNAKQ